MPERELPVELHPSVKERLDADALDSKRSINDITVGILAAHFRVPFAPTGRASNGARGSNSMLIRRLPEKLYEKIHRAAIAPTTKNEVVERILCDHYGVEYVGRRAA